MAPSTTARPIDGPRVERHAQFSRCEYGDEVDVVHADHLRWKYLRSPHGPATVVATEDDGQLVGRIVAQPRRCTVDGDPRRGGYLVDLLVDPAERGMRTFVALTKGLDGVDDVDLLFLTPNDTSAPLYEQVLRYERPGRLGAWASPVRIGRVLGRRVHRALAPVGAVGTGAWWLVRRAAWAVLGRVTRLRFDDVVPTAQAHAALARAVTELPGAVGERDLDWVRWRFEAVPRRTYTLRWIRRGSVLVGYVATREVDLMGLRCLLVLDAVAPGLGRAGRTAVVLECLAQADGARADLVVALAAGDTWLTRVLRTFPMVPVPERLLPQAMPIFQHARADVAPPTAWSLTLADVDVFYMADATAPIPTPVPRAALVPPPHAAGMHFHHVGIACRDLDRALAFVRSTLPVVHQVGPVADPVQDATLCLLTDAQGASVELVAGPVVERLARGGTTYYHVCYEVDDLDAAVAGLHLARAITVVAPVPAVLFDGRLVTFLMTPLGLVELLAAP